MLIQQIDEKVCDVVIIHEIVGVCVTLVLLPKVTLIAYMSKYFCVFCNKKLVIFVSEMTNIMIKPFVCGFAALAFAAMPLHAKTVSASDVIPAPSSFSTVGNDIFKIPATGLRYTIESPRSSRIEEFLITCAPRLVPAQKGEKADLKIKISEADSESYEMTIGKKQITIKGHGEAGAFYGVQTLLQMLSEPDATEIACGKIEDSPRFGYRGLHFDVSRHFRSIDFLKKQIDAMAMLKLNNLHLHLTDAAGWRIEIPGYPRLTEYAAWRPQHTWQLWYDNGQPFCESTAPNAYGGYYTKKELKDLVEYAAARHINIVPEIEMPSHSFEVTSAYPELACGGKPTVGNDDMCIGKENMFRFLEDVFTEVIDIFPSEYIHLGGDEAGKEVWKTCPDCRQRMKDENLTDVDQLQNYAVNRIARFIADKGRKAIGWDEILHPDLDTATAIMSWRGTKGGKEAIAQGRRVVMAPGDTCYLNNAQDAQYKEPLSQGGYLSLEMVYDFEPGTDEQLLGLQGCMWGEYVVTDEHAEYMYYPRAYAIAETGWTPASKKDYDDFRRRAQQFSQVMQQRGYNTFDLSQEVGLRPESLKPVCHRARGAKVIYNTPYSPLYPAGGENALTDGQRGSWHFSDHNWQGIQGDADITVDLGKVMPVNAVMVDFMQSPKSWVHLPQWVEVALSNDGEEFNTVDTMRSETNADAPLAVTRRYATVTGVDATARYVRIRAKRHERPGGGAWLFLDEIIVN